MNVQTLARGLAFFSIGLGTVELVAPRSLARAIGVDEDYAWLLRLLGAREIGAGIGMMQGNTATFTWSRVAGDAIDLGLLGAALRSRKNERKRVIGAIAAVAGVTALDIVAGVLLSRNPADEEWRVRRDERSGLQREDPSAMRRWTDEAMAHQSGHLRERRERVRERENEAVRQFEPGD